MGLGKGLWQRWRGKADARSAQRSALAASPAVSPAVSVAGGPPLPAPRAATAADAAAGASADDELRQLLRRVRQVELVARRAVSSSGAGAWSSRFKGRGMSFSESRAYAPGDDPRHIDWRATARRSDDGRELYVKQFVEERELTVLLVVDVSGSMSTGARSRLRRQVAAEVAAVLTLSALRGNDKVGLVAFSDRLEHLVRPNKGRGHALRLVRDVLSLRPRGRGTDLALGLQTALHLSRQRSIVAVLSDLSGPPVPERRLKAVAARHDVVFIELVDPLEQTLPDVGLLGVVDPETGREGLIDTSDQAVRKRYAADGARRRAEAHAAVSRCGVERVSLAVGDDDALRALVRFLRSRARRAA